MKPIISIFITIVVIASLGVGISAYYWNSIDEKIENIYKAPKEEAFFEDDEDEEPIEEPPKEEGSFEIEEQNAQNLITLAINSVNEDPEKCWQYLEKALEKDPHNLNVRVFRAEILEAAGKPSLAQEEYFLAEAENPHDITFVNQYACFLMRTGRYDDAFMLVRDHLGPRANTNIWLKASFLNKIYRPLSFNWSKNRIPQGLVKPLVRYLVKLPNDQFWNGAAYSQVQYNHDFLQSQQTTYWLQLLEALDNRKEALALKILNQNPFQLQSWNPQLELNLLRILTFRQNRSLQINEKGPLFTRFKKSAQKLTPLTYELNELAEKEAMTLNYEIPSQMRQLLLSDEIFSLALIDTNWNEAAIRLHSVDQYPSYFPEWAGLRLTQALRQNRGNIAALQFAKHQNKTPELNLLIAELLLIAGDKGQAVTTLFTLSEMESPIGLKASKLLVEAYIKNNEYQKAREFIERSPHLSNHVTGHELVARTFIEEKQPELAYRIYLNIENESPEAKSFLARRAFLSEDWDRARVLTEELIVLYPDNEMFKQNLDKINEKLNQNKSE